MPADVVVGRLLTVREVATRLGVNERTVRRKIEAGVLPAVRLGPGRSAIRVDADELERFLYGPPEEAA
jgi:excisionase family DNA binding protein